MAPLRGAYDHVEVVDFTKGILHSFEVAEMERLAPPNEQTDPHPSSFGPAWQAVYKKTSTTD